MTELNELKDLRLRLSKVSELESRVSQKQNEITKKEASFYKPNEMKQTYWKFNTFRKIMPWFFIIIGIYAVLYFVVGIIYVGLDIIMAIPNWIMDKSGPGWIAYVTHWVGFPMAWLGDFAYHIIEKVPMVENQMANWGIGHFMSGLLITIVTVPLIVFILDLIIMIIKNPITKIQNNAIRRNNTVNRMTGEILVEEWRKSTEYNDKIKEISNLRNLISKENDVIKRSTFLHSEYKTWRRVDALIDYLEKKRARDLTGAINLMLEEEYKMKQAMADLEERVERREEMKQLRRIEENRLSLQARQTAASERSAEANKRTAAEAKYKNDMDDIDRLMRL